MKKFRKAAAFAVSVLLSVSLLTANISAAEDIHSGKIIHDDVITEVFEPDNTQTSGICPIFFVKGFDYNTDNSDIREKALYYNKSGETCMIIDRLLYSEISVMKGKELPADSINEKLTDAEIKLEDGNYILYSKTLKSKNDAVKLLGTYSEISEINDIFCWEKADWTCSRAEVFGKGEKLDSSLKLCEDIFPVENTEDTENYKTVVFSEPLTSETILSDVQLEAIDTIRNSLGGMNLCPEITGTEQIKKYKICSYRAGLSFSVTGNAGLRYDEVIEERKTDGTKVIRFAGFSRPILTVSEEPDNIDFNHYYYVEGPHPYLAYQTASGLKLIPDFSCKPKYYFDNSTKAIRSCETDEYIATLRQFFITTGPNSRYPNSSRGCYYTADDSYSYDENDIDANLANEYQTVTRGDINDDCDIDMTDMSELSLYILGDGKEESSAMELKSDSDANGVVNVADLARLMQFVTKQVSSLK